MNNRSLSALRRYRHVNLTILLTITTLTLSILGQCEAYQIGKVKEEQPRPKPLMRAWMCGGKSHQEMIDKLARANIVKSPIVKRTLLKVDRRNYVPDEQAHGAYDDNPIPLLKGQAISAPHMHAHCLEDLLPTLLRASTDRPDEPLSILDVGCGSGYLTACLGRLVEEMAGGTSQKDDIKEEKKKDKVYGIDVVPELIQMAKRNISAQDGDLLESGTVTCTLADGWHGYADGSPYDCIHVGAAAAAFPRELMKQLKVGGLLVLPLGPNGGTQHLYQVERIGDAGQIVGVTDASRGYKEADYSLRKLFGVRYVPLVKTEL